MIKYIKRFFSKRNNVGMLDKNKEMYREFNEMDLKPYFGYLLK